ncbi:MAG: phytoene desaturase family protein [candidate division KSB1 bacterium]|jgi:phytoene desaturase|nr:phytoene desaturase family protein [candidate division KSB1 bacterium]
MKKAVIIGSGFGGLSLAARLQAKGIQVTLLEMNSMVGGHAYQMKKDGYTFDLGPSLITAPDIIQDIFQTAGKRMEDYVELIPLDPFYRIYFHDGTYIDYQGNTEKMKEQMGKFNKKDAEQYDRFMENARQIYEKVIVDGLGKQPFTMSALLRFMPAALKLKVPFPAYNVVKSYFSDIRNVFTFSFNTLFIGGNPFRAPSVYLMIPYLEKTGGIWFSKGGMYSLVQALEKLFIELGGELKTNAEVTEITVENGRATGAVANGEHYPADIVVSNAHFANTHLDLLKPEYRRKWSDRKVKKMDYSMSSFLLYIGTKKQYPKLLHHTLIIAERYRELIFDIFDRKILSDDFSIYCHAPTRTDASMAPKGCESMYVLVPVPNLQGDIDWDVQAKPFADKVLNYLENDFGLDGLRDNLEVLEIFTPKDFEEQRNNYIGSAWGLEPKLTQTASFRPSNRSEDVKGFYLVGASTHPGAGVPGVMLSAEATQNAIMKDLES